jgi:hypothetical protein
VKQARERTCTCNSLHGDGRRRGGRAGGRGAGKSALRRAEYLNSTRSSAASMRQAPLTHALRNAEQERALSLSLSLSYPSSIASSLTHLRAMGLRVRDKGEEKKTEARSASGRETQEEKARSARSASSEGSPFLFGGGAGEGGGQH